MFIVLLSFFLAIAPAILLVVYYYKQDKEKPEPKGLIIRTFIIGLISTIPAVLIESYVSPFEDLLKQSPVVYYLFDAFIVAAISEEFIKLIVIKVFIYNNIHFDEAMDGIVYTIVASLGFACMENVLFVIDGGLKVALIRAFTAIPLHAVASGLMGYYIGMAKFSDTRQKESALIRKGFWIAVLIHGMYNFLLFLSDDLSYENHPDNMTYRVISLILGYSVLPLLLISFFNLKNKIKKAIAEDIVEGRTINYPEESQKDQS